MGQSQAGNMFVLVPLSRPDVTECYRLHVADIVRSLNLRE
jgi:hypothetical protein